MMVSKQVQKGDRGSAILRIWESLVTVFDWRVLRVMPHKQFNRCVLFYLNQNLPFGLVSISGLQWFQLRERIYRKNKNFFSFPRVW